MWNLRCGTYVWVSCYTICLIYIFRAYLSQRKFIFLFLALFIAPAPALFIYLFIYLFSSLFLSIFLSFYLPLYPSHFLFISIYPCISLILKSFHLKSSQFRQIFLYIFLFSFSSSTFPFILILHSPDLISNFNLPRVFLCPKKIYSSFFLLFISFVYTATIIIFISISILIFLSDSYFYFLMNIYNHLSVFWTPFPRVWTIIVHLLIIVLGEEIEEYLSVFVSLQRLVVF